MPQFDFYSFSGQNIWFLLFFLSFYFITVYLYVASFSETLKMRQKLLNSYENIGLGARTLKLYHYFIIIKM